MRNLARFIRDDTLLQNALGLVPYKNGSRVRIFNPWMRMAREVLGLTQEELGEQVNGFRSSMMSQIEEFRYFPSPELAERIAKVLRTSRQELFPDWLRAYLCDSSCRECVSTLSEIEAALRGHIRTWPALIHSSSGDVEEEVAAHEEIEERCAILTTMIDSLSPRYRRVLELRFPRDGRRAKTLDEAGRALGVTKEGARQIETKALAELSAMRA